MLAWLVGAPWYVVVLVVVLRMIRIRFARTVEGKKIRTEFEIAINDQGKPRPPMTP